MITEQQIEQYVTRFFELLALDNPTKTQQNEIATLIHTLGLTQADLRDFAAQCRRRAIYLANTQ